MALSTGRLVTVRTGITGRHITVSDHPSRKKPLHAAAIHTSDNGPGADARALTKGSARPLRS